MQDFYRILGVILFYAGTAAGQSAPPASQESPLHSLTALLNGSGFVQITPGEFTMGSATGNPDEEPAHRVRISRGFEIGKFEVTQAQWIAVMGNPHAKLSPDAVNPSHFKAPSRPIENVSWDAVQKFIALLNTRDAKHEYRLPTEAEWEYAARAGTAAGTQADAKDLDRNAWYKPNSDGQTQPVGQKPPNPWGLHDMLGNVFEWVQDWYAADYSGSAPTDPRGSATGTYRVYRGCAWLSEPKYCRAAFRGFDFPNTGYYSVGFRLVRTPK